MPDVEITQQIKAKAAELGFSRSAICPAAAPERLRLFHDWLDAGYDGEMHYLKARREAYEHPRHVLAGVQSVVMLTMNYRSQARIPASFGQGQISQYAWGSVDYHELIRARLHELADYVRERIAGVEVRGVVDTAPLLEREFAQFAGLGWVGKNTLLIHPSAGSYFFLAALLVGHELDHDEPFATDHCGTCRACIEACPTQAFPQPYVLDASRCISYLTIELKSPMPVELRPGVGNWLFGCDVCQDVCPWNSKSPETRFHEFHPTSDANPIDLSRLFEMTEQDFRERFRATPLWRAKRRGLLRNAAIVLGNQGQASGCTALKRGLSDSEALVREASAWALGTIRSSEAAAVLEERLPIESDEFVRNAIELALRSIRSGQ